MLLAGEGGWRAWPDPYPLTFAGVSLARLRADRRVERRRSGLASARRARSGGGLRNGARASFTPRPGVLATLVCSSWPLVQPIECRLTLSQSIFTPRPGSAGTSMNPFAALSGRTRISPSAGSLRHHIRRGSARARSVRADGAHARRRNAPRLRGRFPSPRHVETI